MHLRVLLEALYLRQLTGTQDTLAIVVKDTMQPHFPTTSFIKPRALVLTTVRVPSMHMLTAGPIHCETARYTG